MTLSYSRRLRRVEGAACGVVLVFLLGTIAQAEDRERTSVNLISAETSADGLTRVHRELLEECILNLPTPGELVPVVNRKEEFLKAIDGDLDRNESTRTYSAVIDVGYVVRQMALVIVTTSSIEAQEPIIREVERRLPRSEQFRSDSNNGDHFAGRGLARVYYFGTRQGAIDDARERAVAWLAQQKTISCAN